MNAEGVATRHGDRRPLTAVIAEDDALLAEDLVGELEHHGLEVLARARTEEEAVAAALRHDPWIVLLDVSLAEGDGVEAARRLHEHDGRRCVFLSGYLDPVIRKRINVLEPLAVLSKPLLSSQLLDVITHARRIGGGGRDGAYPPAGDDGPGAR